jgi:hypothetical protein
MLYKIKMYNRAGPALRAEAAAQTRHGSRVGPDPTLLNGPCFGPAHQARPIWPSIHAAISARLCFSHRNARQTFACYY